MSELARLTAGFAAPYFTLVEPQMPPAFREQRRAMARGWARLLEPDFEVVDVGLVTSAQDGEAAGRQLREADVDVLVLAPTMVAPPGHALSCLPSNSTPVVLWTVPGMRRLPDELSPSQAAANSMQSGVAMIANVLHRRAHPFAAVAAAPDDPQALERLVRTVRGSALAGSLRRTTALRVGEPVEGYDDVVSSTEDLARLGVIEQEVQAESMHRAFDEATPDAARTLLERLRNEGWSFQEHELLEHSARVAVALISLAESSGAACGTVNCHGPCFRTSEPIGIPACLGVSVLTGRGIPFSCTGDQPTALAMLIAKRLSGAALYCEVNSAEAETGLALLSAGGEGDPAWRAAEASVNVVPNRFFPGARGQGAGVTFTVGTGPATLLSFSPLGATWRLVSATGEITESRFETLETPNAMFRFDAGDAVSTCERWTASGATHHAAVAPGRLDVELEAFAAALNIESTRI